jgi:hypothetical protein
MKGPTGLMTVPGCRPYAPTGTNSRIWICDWGLRIEQFLLYLHSSVLIRSLIWKHWYQGYPLDLIRVRNGDFITSKFCRAGILPAWEQHY